MATGKMLDDELDTDEAQFPQWADLPIRRVRSAGTGNAIYRLGREMAVRLARVNCEENP